MRIILIMALLSSGCASMSQDEIAWQAAHIIDVAQTVSMTKNPECYLEIDPITSNLIGHYPSEQDVYIWGVLSSVAHYSIMKYTDKNTKWGKTLRFIDQSVKVGAVNNNANIGIRVDSNNRGCA